MAVLSRVLLVAVCIGGLAACEKKPETTAEVVEDKVGDMLDTRANENFKDAAEDASSAVSEAAEGVKDSVKEAAE